MRPSWDDRAVEAIPLRLMVVAAVAAMSVLPAAQALETMNDRDFVSRAGLLLDRVVRTAQVVCLEGPGSARTVDIDLSSDGSVRAVMLSVGDEPGGPGACAVVLELSTGAKIVRLAQSPGVAMTSPLGGSLEVRSERFSLRMEAAPSYSVCTVSVGAA